MPKFVFVTGGVCSSLGKGIASASIAKILKSAGFRVSVQKLDPYLNVDPGTMSPFQHGEVFVTDDGAETDLDLGHYERFIDEYLTESSSVTTGKIYRHVLEKERQGEFLGGTIQVVPHIVDEIKQRIQKAAEATQADVLVVEIGGTVGDIEGEPFLEAIRQIRQERGSHNAVSVHLTLLPYLAGSKELKTKPTQLSVREIRRAGIQPEIIVARADQEIPKELLLKIAKFCNTKEDAVFAAPTVKSIYEVPLIFEDQKIAAVLERELKLPKIRPKMSEWKKMLENMNGTHESIKIGMAGKYTGLEDAYLSVIESIKFAAYSVNRQVEIVWIDTEKIEKGVQKEMRKLEEISGVIVPGGFGNRGIEGKIAVAKYARENNLPYLGLCLGSQIMAIEFARNVLGIKNATSEEFQPHAKNKIIHFLPGQSESVRKGGTLRLGAWPCVVQKGTMTHEAYQKEEISERHRHRYEFNLEFRKPFEEKGFLFSGMSPDNNLVEIVEIARHPFMIGSQFHPEFLSRPGKPHPLFACFLQVATKLQK
ncbi:CTP synthase [Candidatus Peregrinibacteria bacterium]|nr:MAG: CTP synthase [Candidatus Peregrinibacteria bacterium]